MKILDFGSINIDDVYAVDHFVRPGETMSSLGYEQFCGGKGLNQSIALARAGAEVYHACMVGEGADFLVKTMEESGVNTKWMKKTDVAAGRAIIQVDKNGQNCIILFGGSNQANTKEYIREVIDSFEPGDIVLLQNELNLIDYIIDYAHEKGLVIALNPSPMNEKILACDLSKVTYFILNEVEGSDIAGGETDPDKICDTLLTKYPGCKVVLTLGMKGSVYTDGKQKVTHGVYKVDAVDTTAAGDTYTGYFLSMITKGSSVEEALDVAAKASAIAVSRNGASPSIPTMDEVAATTLPMREQ